MIQAPEASSQTRKNPRRQFTCALLLTGVSTTRRGIPKWGITLLPATKMDRGRTAATGHGPAGPARSPTPCGAMPFPCSALAQRNLTRAVTKADKMSAVFRHSSPAAGNRSKIPGRMATIKVTAGRIVLAIADADATVVADIGRTVRIVQTARILVADTSKTWRPNRCRKTTAAPATSRDNQNNQQRKTRRRIYLPGD